MSVSLHVAFRLLVACACVHVLNRSVEKCHRVHFRIDRLTGVATRLRPGVGEGGVRCAPVHPFLRFCKMCLNRRYSNAFHRFSIKYSSILAANRGALAQRGCAPRCATLGHGCATCALSRAQCNFVECIENRGVYHHDHQNIDSFTVQIT